MKSLSQSVENSIIYWTGLNNIKQQEELTQRLVKIEEEYLGAIDRYESRYGGKGLCSYLNPITKLAINDARKAYE